MSEQYRPPGRGPAPPSNTEHEIERERFRTHPYTVISTVVALLTLMVTVLVWAPWKHADASAGSFQCPTKSLLSATDAPDRLRPPSHLTISWSYSETVAGTDEATIHWKNNDSRAVFGLIEIVGRYGTPNADDETIVVDGRPLPDDGDCGDWYRRYNQVSESLTGVFFDGLWPEEQYCFSVNASNAAGGNGAPYPSIESLPVCETAPWEPQWGTAAVPPVTPAADSPG
jgi:hypothetical protein